MGDQVWEPLAELELNLYRSKNSPVYCLCSRAFIRSKIEGDSWADFFKELEKPEQNEMDDKPITVSHDINGHNSDMQSVRKQELEAVSCYCSASHYSTDDYESVMQSTSDHFQTTAKEPSLPCPLQNSDSGADLSENFVEKPCCKITEDPNEDLDLSCNFSKSKADMAWEKYWSENGEGIIWKSWIEKYGAYINQSYLDQNSLDENQMETDDASKPESAEKDVLRNSSDKTDVASSCKTKESNVFNVSKVDNTPKENMDSIPDLKISSYSSCTNLSDIGDSKKNSMNIDDSDSEDKLLKSNSFGSYVGYEKEEKYNNPDEERGKGFERERVRSRCSNTSLSVKSVANTTVTTDSMTNVTKITLSSLDLSCECESVRSSSLLSTSSDDSSGPTSSSSSSSKEEMCTEADMWWRKVWKEHYQEQYMSCYELFSKDYSQINQDESLNEAKQQLIEKVDDMIEDCEETEPIYGRSAYLQSVGYILQVLDATKLENQPGVPTGDNEDCKKEEEKAEAEVVEHNIKPNESLKRHLEQSEESENNDDNDENEEEREDEKNDVKNQSQGKKSHSSETNWRNEKPKKLDHVRQALSLMGYSFRPDWDGIKSGYVTYRKRNIRAQNRKLKLTESKSRTHIFFDDDGNPYFESERNESVDTPEPLNEILEDKNDENAFKIKDTVLEPESLGYEAHSSSVDDENDFVDDFKKQKKKRKKQKKCNNLPQEIVENKNLFKYWLRRYQLFLKFDEGIRLDPESWFSVTPEKVAKHHAERCRCDVIIDAFCGAGGNSIQFAFTCEKVIAIDIDAQKIEIARHNARVYGVEERIEFIVGDFTKIAHLLKSDVVFLSPPWGGPKYHRSDVYNLDKILPPVGGHELYRLASQIAPHVAYFLPRNINSTELALLPGPGGEVEIEQNFLDRKLVAITAYFGELILDANNPQLMDM